MAEECVIDNVVWSPLPLAGGTVVIGSCPERVTVRQKYSMVELVHFVLGVERDQRRRVSEQVSVG